MTQKIVALVGVSGVGKTTFLHGLAGLVEFQHLSAGSLIASEKQIQEAERDHLRLENVPDNQRLLIDGFHRASDPDASVVILDGHVFVHTPEGLEAVAAQVFTSLHIQSIIHLEAPPEKILENRTRDKARSRPLLTAAEISDHQDFSLATAADIAKQLQIQNLTISHNDICQVADLLADQQTKRTLT